MTFPYSKSETTAIMELLNNTEQGCKTCNIPLIVNLTSVY